MPTDSWYKMAEFDYAELIEWRFDWLPSRLDFFVNGKLVYHTTANIPQKPGSLEISYWSNGNPRTGPVPERIGAFTVASAKAYYNTTQASSDIAKAWQDGSCKRQDLSSRTHAIPMLADWQRFQYTGESFSFSDKQSWQHTLGLQGWPDESSSADQVAPRVWGGLGAAVIAFLLIKAVYITAVGEDRIYAEEPWRRYELLQT